MRAPQAEDTSLPRALGLAWACLFTASVGLSLLEVAVVSTRVPMTPSFALRYLAANVALASLVMLVPASLIGLLWLGARAIRARTTASARPLTSHLAEGALWGLAAGAGAVFVMRPWTVYDPLRIDLIAAAAALGVGGVGAWLLHRGRALALAALLLAGSLAAALADTFVQPHHFARLHDLAAFCAIALASAGLWLVRDRWLRRPVVLALLALVVLGQLGAWVRAREVLTVGLFHGSLQPKLLVVLRSLADADRDGYSALIGGGDCDDFDPARRPATCEGQHDGVDDNCNGIDETKSGPLERAVATTGERRDPLPDVVIIIVDTLRADYGGQPRPPAFAALARTSLDFAVAYTPYPSTHHALTALAQGRYWRYTDPALPSLGTLLRDAGYDQHMWHGTRRITLGPEAPLFSDDEAAREHLRMDKQDKDRHTQAVIDDMVATLTESEQPARPQLWWLHLDDPHYPWVRGEPSESNLTRYRREIDHVDQQLARLWAALDASERGREAVVILFGDHGEEFGEHGGQLHGGTLYEEGVRVPMLLRLPGVEPRAIAATASLLDVLPTLVHYLGLPDPGTLQGHDWLASADPPGARVLAEIERAPGTLSVAHRATLQLIRDGPLALIADLDRNAVLVFDLDDDPNELRSIAHSQPEVTRALMDRLARWQDAPGCRAPAVE